MLLLVVDACAAVACSAVACSAVACSAVACVAVACFAVACSAVACAAVACSAVACVAVVAFCSYHLNRLVPLLVVVLPIPVSIGAVVVVGPTSVLSVIGATARR